MSTVDGTGVFRTAAVPSRLYVRPKQERPLSGVRVSLKDNIELAGTRTTLMNRAYTQLYGPDEASAQYVQRLVDLGAVVVGKTKLCSFASAEEPTDQWVDYHCPFNPRGDFYQTPSGSTTGGEASTAGYDWMDIAVGTDTTGSIRSPAAWNGLFSIRTSFGTLPTAGMKESCKLFDTVGLLSRSVDGLHSVVNATGHFDNSESFPSRLLYPTDFFPQADAEQQNITDEFVHILEEFLGA